MKITTIKSKYSLMLFTRDTRINPRSMSNIDVRIIPNVKKIILKSIPPKIFNRTMNINAEITESIVNDVIFESK
jgi:hypothetical protein